MAGRARLQALKDELDKRVAVTFDTDDADAWKGDAPPSHLDYVCAWYESGKTGKALAADLQQKLKHDVTYESLMRYLRNSFGNEATESALSEARVRASHSLAEASMQIVDDADETSKSGVAKAMARARTRQWMAERYNPSTFGQKQQTNVAISITGLHLDALRARPNTVTGGSSAPSITDGSVQDAQVEVIEQHVVS